MLITFQAFPPELQTEILSFLDSHTLSSMCRTNKTISDITTPVLWRTIDFGDESSRDQLARFFAACDLLRVQNPGRWRYLASQVRCLIAGWLEDVYIHYLDDDEIIYSHLERGQFGLVSRNATIWDIIADLSNLRELSLYPYEALDFPRPKRFLCEGLRLPHLKKLQIGGDISTENMLALLDTPENIRDLSLFALQEGEAGYDHGPSTLLSLSTIQERFSNLKTLHLCKFTELTGRCYDRLTFGWSSYEANDRAILEEWKTFIRHVSSTLEHLTLEDRYLIFEVDAGPPEHWTGASNERFQQILLPTLATQSWPLMKMLTLVGLYPVHLDTQLDLLHDLRPRMDVEYYPCNVLKSREYANRTKIDALDQFPYWAGW